MKIFLPLGFISAVCLLSSHLFLAPVLATNTGLKDRQDINQAAWRSPSGFLAQVSLPVIMRRLSGSQNRGTTVRDREQSLACTLEKWQLIGIFKNGQIANTKGELTFEITNHSSKAQRFALGELLFLNDRQRALTVSNPHRQLQGQFIKFEPPLKPGETRTYTENIWYESGWDKVELKTCRWLKTGKEYWEIYPEIKPEKKSEN